MSRRLDCRHENKAGEPADAANEANQNQHDDYTQGQCMVLWRWLEGNAPEMSIGTAFRSETIAWLLGAVSLAVLSAFAFSLIGWIGIGAVGLLGLFVTTNVALQAGHALADGDDARIYARQLEEARKSQLSPEQKLAAEAIRAKRSKVLYLLNTIFVAMTILGFWMFFGQL